MWCRSPLLVPSYILAHLQKSQCSIVSDLKEVYSPNHSLKECGSMYISCNPHSDHADPNTLHPHKNSRKYTWHSPIGLTHNQIYYILTLQRFKSSVRKALTRTYPVADINSLVLCHMKLKL